MIVSERIDGFCALIRAFRLAVWSAAVMGPWAITENGLEPHASSGHHGAQDYGGPIIMPMPAVKTNTNGTAKGLRWAPVYCTAKSSAKDPIIKRKF